MSGESRFLAPTPPDICQEIGKASQEGGALELAGHHTMAFEVFRRTYEHVLGSQPHGRRFHTGAVSAGARYGPTRARRSAM
jgi:hypothetical protein